MGYVIDSADPMYCGTAQCVYHVQADIKNIDKLEVYLGEHIEVETLNKNGHSVAFV